MLCEEFAFSSSLSSGRAKGIEFVPVKMDEHGLIPEDLDRILSQWDVTLQGKKVRTSSLNPFHTLTFAYP